MISESAMNRNHMEEIQFVAALEKEIFSDAWSEAALTESLAQPWNHLLVARDSANAVGEEGTQLPESSQEGAAPTGYLLYSLVSGEAELLRVAVAPDFRRKGVAGRLFRQMLEKLRQEKAEALFLEVRSGNEPARALYKSFGMEEIGRRKKYYRDPEEDAVLYRLHVSEEA